MTETLTGKQVLALLAQDEPPEIEVYNEATEGWQPIDPALRTVKAMLETTAEFRIKPTPARRLSVTLANGEVVSWPEPVREALKDGRGYLTVRSDGVVADPVWRGTAYDLGLLAFGNVHLTREAAQEHADALRKINRQEVGK